MSDAVHIPLVFDQSQYDEFARLSGDDNPIHVDPEFSARTKFGRTVAHGMFIFSVLSAHIGKHVEGDHRLAVQDLMFSKPTFTGDPLDLTLDFGREGLVAQVLRDSSGDVTASGLATLGGPVPAEPDLVVVSDESMHRGLRVGMSARRVREFSAVDVDEFLDLVDDPSPAYRGRMPELPPGLLGGSVSWLLGVELPGRGTNWLKQRYMFHMPVRVPTTVTTTVTISRLRPEKDLVNLRTSCETSEGTAVTGEALVWVSDLEGS